MATGTFVGEGDSGLVEFGERINFLEINSFFEVCIFGLFLKKVLHEKSINYVVFMSLLYSYDIRDLPNINQIIGVEIVRKRQNVGVIERKLG